MKTFYFIIALTWFPGILSSQIQILLNQLSDEYNLEDPGRTNMMHLSELPCEIRLPELNNTGLIDISIIHKNYFACSPFKLDKTPPNRVLGDIKTIIKSTSQFEVVAKDLENEATQPDTIDNYYNNELFEESIWSDRIITIAGEYLLTDINYSLAGKTLNK